jgi:hypothetical protein
VNFVLFFLRRHPDGWALLRNVSRATGSETQIEALKWADGVLTSRFDIEREDWILGPTTGESGLLALYANASSEPVAKPFPLDAYLRWRYRPSHAGALGYYLSCSTRLAGNAADQ